MKQTEEYFLGEEGVILFDEIQYGKLNIINAPCGSGKTTFVEKKLWEESYWGDLLYLIDSRNALEAFKIRGEEREYNGKIYYKHRGITAMTYATFAALCIYKPDEWLWNDEDALIVCDELQSVIKWSHIKNGEDELRFRKDSNLHKTALDELHKRIKIGARVVAITATPDSIHKEFKDEFLNVPIHGVLKQYHAAHTCTFQNLSSLVTTLPADKRGVIYTPHVTQIHSIRDQLQKRGIKAVGFWSENNINHDMDDEEWAVRDSVILKGIIPNDVQVLLINAASETGINITSPVDYIVVNDSNPDTQIQAIGRVRHDVDTVYLRDYSSQNYTYISYTRLAEKWLDRRLYEEDKRLLCEELNIRDERGRLYKWPNVKRSLRFSGFRVTDKQEKNGRRYSIIEW